MNLVNPAALERGVHPQALVDGRNEVHAHAATSAPSGHFGLLEWYSDKKQRGKRKKTRKKADDSHARSDDHENDDGEEDRDDAIEEPVALPPASAKKKVRPNRGPAEECPPVGLPADSSWVEGGS
jgi:hypothetical protein